MPQAPKPRKEAFSRNPKQQGTPLYSEVTTFGDLVFVSGHGVATHGDVKAQTTEVLNQIAAALQKAGSSMNQVMKCNVYLKTLDDYKAMNEAFHALTSVEPSKSWTPGNGRKPKTFSTRHSSFPLPGAKLSSSRRVPGSRICWLKCVHSSTPMPPIR
jgi:enamine deaminase RidA (YjgF/YER057c/UK114 family)